MGVGVKHLSNQVAKPDVSRAASSCDSDVDRQELISNYASENYLSRWSLESEEAQSPTFEVTITPKPPAESPTETEQLEIQNDVKRLSVDNTSLESYHSVQHDTPTEPEAPTTPKQEIPVSYLPYQLSHAPFQSISVWQGYSGNIYFDPVRCQAMRINSANQKQSNRRNHSCHRKTKSCSPTFKPYSAAPERYYGPCHMLGSLRFAATSHKNSKNNKKGPSKSGKILKGFSQENLKQTKFGEYVHVRSESAPESLSIAGGHVGDGYVDPIDRVRRHNVRARMSSKSTAYSEVSGKGFPALVAKKWAASQRKERFDVGRMLRFPDLEDSAESVCTSESESTQIRADPKPVFIIPFATFDDPVETNLKGKAKPSRKSPQRRDNDDSDVVTEVSKISREKSEIDIVKQSNDVLYSEEHLKSEDPLPKETHPENGPDPASKRSWADLSIRRQISNASLTNYLRTVSNQPPGTATSRAVPKLSYTQRSSVISERYFFHDYSLRTPRVSALYGGYIPPTRQPHAKPFRAEITTEETSDDADSVTVRDSMSELTESRGEGMVGRRHSPRRGGVRTSFASRKEPLSKASVDGRSKRPNEQDNCRLPVIGRHVLKSDNT
ncbi:uncharacterized protein LOC5514154 [Nematostella vectensis]|uniref:uncharacterized protein LOC5514154 n=1 Tax=Nematostella vectensis TaxID=45351 RepID=UPI0020777EBC|nr:uncharacterized protein LOC5514154 [Nematostella vectensis]XP_032239643.2 uncharacterized protein LOC5514154 [Nematostella vectensis]